MQCHNHVTWKKTPTSFGAIGSTVEKLVFSTGCRTGCSTPKVEETSLISYSGDNQLKLAFNSDLFCLASSQEAVLFRQVLVELRDWVPKVVATVLVAVVAELVAYPCNPQTV